MSKPLPKHVTRAEVAEVLRLSLRQVDRLAATGKLKKTKLSASRSGFAREDVDRYLESVGESGDGYRSPYSFVALGIGDTPRDINEIAALLDQLLLKRLPGCFVFVRDDEIHIFWNACLQYTGEMIFEVIRQT